MWSDKYGDHWECLLDKEQFCSTPVYLDIDDDRRMMAVAERGTIIHIYTFYIEQVFMLNLFSTDW